MLIHQLNTDNTPIVSPLCDDASCDDPPCDALCGDAPCDALCDVFLHVCHVCLHVCHVFLHDGHRDDRHVHGHQQRLQRQRQPRREASR